MKARAIKLGPYIHLDEGSSKLSLIPSFDLLLRLTDFATFCHFCVQVIFSDPIRTRAIKLAHAYILISEAQSYYQY